MLVLDTEGLQSVEKDDEEFDRKITLFCLAVSHLVLVNIKGDMHNNMKKLLEICVIALDELKKARMGTPHLQFVFNQNSNTAKNPFAQQVENITAEIISARPEAADVARIMDVRDEDLFVLSFAFNVESRERNVDQGQLEDWCRCTPISQFAVEVNKIAQRMSQVMRLQAGSRGSSASASSAWSSSSGNSRANAGEAAETKHFKHLAAWLEMAAKNWNTIERYSDLVSFADLEHMRHDRELRGLAGVWEREQLKDCTPDHEKLLNDLITEHINKDLMCVRNYVEGRIPLIQRGIEDYFDGVYKTIEKSLCRAALERDYRKQLVDTYKRNLRGRVDQYRHENLQRVSTIIQKMKAEAGRTHGQLELEEAMRALILTGRQIENQEANRKFEEAWDAMMAKRLKDLNFEDMDSQLLQSLKDLYKHEQPLPASLQKDRDYQESLRKCAKEDVMLVGAQLEMDFLYDDVLRPCKPAVHCDSLTPAVLQRLYQKSDYISMLDFYTPVHTKHSCKLRHLPEFVDWPMFRDELYRIFSFLSYDYAHDQAKKNLQQLLTTFDDLGWKFSDLFDRKLRNLMNRCKNDTIFWRERDLREVLSLYGCFYDVKGEGFYPVGKLPAGVHADHKERYAHLLNKYSYVLSGPGFDESRPVEFVQWHLLKTDIINCVRRADETSASAAMGQLQEIGRYFQCFGMQLNSDFKASLISIMKSWKWFSSSTRAEDAETLLCRNWGCFYPNYPLIFSRSGQQRSMQEIRRLPCMSYLRARENFLTSHSVELSAPRFSEIPRLPEDASELRDSKIELRIKPQYQKKYGHGLRYLLDPTGFESHLQQTAVEQLSKLVSENIKGGGWNTIFTDLAGVIKNEIQFEEQAASVSSFSGAVVKRIHQGVKVFLKDRVDEQFSRFGVVLDMDGIATMHFFALLQSWKLVSEGQRERMLHSSVKGMERDKENYRRYFVSSVCQNAVEQSKAAAASFIREIYRAFVETKRNAAGELVRVKLDREKDQFFAHTIQQELDEDLLFSGRGESNVVVRYITQQTAHVTEIFDRRFGAMFDSLREGVIMDTQTELREGLQQLRTCLEAFATFLRNADLKDVLSEKLFSDAREGAIFESSGRESKNRAAYDTIVSFCRGEPEVGKRAPRLEGLVAGQMAGLIEYRSTTPKEIPMLYEFVCV